MNLSFLTPTLLVLLTVIYGFLIMRVSFLWAFIPAVIVAHRIGILLHEYIHGIPFRRYRSNNNVVTFYDGLLLTFGVMEVFRATHLAHHRWLNTPLDPALQSDTR